MRDRIRINMSENLVGCLLRVIFISALFFPAFCLAAERVMIATPSRGFFEMPVVVAMRNGYFKKEGLEVYKVQIQPAIAVKALVAGEVDYNLDLESSVRAAMTGIPIKVVATMTTKPMQVFIARPEIRSARDLKSKTVGGDAFSGTVDYLARAAARYLGLDPDRDLNIIETGDSSIRLTALREGSIDATVLDVVLGAKAEAEGFKQLLNLGDIIDLPLFGIALTDAKLANHRDQIKKVIRAALRGTRFMKQNRAEALRIMQSYLGIKPGQAVPIYEATIRSFADDGSVSNRAVALEMRRAKEELQIAEDPPFSQVVDWSVLGEIKLERAKIPFWIRQD
ncbi:MAG TPA: ABC transporter substrate-binding protein [Terriglobales bacterium]|nr:ABC transporter substrate-binding protein [Terriglobales bacterium]